MDPDLGGKLASITGGSRAIGRARAQRRLPVDELYRLNFFDWPGAHLRYHGATGQTGRV
jgi:hypothetical protein